MECFIVSRKDVSIERGTLWLSEDEAHHALKSLRMREGERLMATDMRGNCYECEFRRAGGHANSPTAECGIIQVLPEYGEAKRKVRLIQGMISQPARWEFLLEKATELGVSSIQPVTTSRTERERFKEDRSLRILHAAVKQTKRARLPKLLLKPMIGASSEASRASTKQTLKQAPGELSSLSEALSEAVREKQQIVLLHESASTDAGLWKLTSSLGIDQPITIVVGPEGGFSDEEVQSACDDFGARIASLGSRRLRAETAAIAALAIAIDQ